MEQLPKEIAIQLAEINNYAREMRDYILQIRDCLTAGHAARGPSLRDQKLLDTAVRMLELLEGRMDPPMDLNEELMDALDLKLLLKVGDTKFASMKKLFKTYEVNKKPYYLKHEVLEIIKHYEVSPNADNTIP